MKEIRLERLVLYNFKNYLEAELDFSHKVVCFVGDNGSGKTNLLDAIHYLSVCRSFFNPADSLNITTGHEQASITGDFLRDDIPEHIICGLRKGQRKIFKRNFKDYERLADHIGLLPVVIITPYDIELIWEGSELRRKFMDSTISQQSRSYLDALVAYNHALSQRNNLLKNSGRFGSIPFSYDLIEPWDYQLIEYGKTIFEERKKFIEGFVPRANDIYHSICGGKETVDILYESELLTSSMEVLLQNNREKDRTLERTSSGIHKDNLNFTIDGMPMKKYGSQGQQKSFLFSLKFAQYIFIRESQDYCPILLLDDLLDKIDESRLMRILEWLKENNSGQVFITDTHIDRIPELLKKIDIPGEVWQIQDGSAHKFSNAE